MKLSAIERVVLFDLLPKEGDFVTIKDLRKLKESLTLTKEERGKAGLVDEGEFIRLKTPSAVEDKDFKIENLSKDIVIKALKTLNDQAKLTENHISLYEKFIKE